MTGALLRGVDWIRHWARCRRWRAEQALGRRGEDLAHRFLRRQGLIVAARNYRPPGGQGEIDLVCWEGETLVLVEVKTRSTEEFGPPDRAVDAPKREALIRAARHYARRAGADWEMVRFDVVDVILGRFERIEHIRDAFSPRLRASR